MTLPDRTLTEIQSLRESRDGWKRGYEAKERRVQDLETALTDALSWIVNKWEWDQEHYDQLDAVQRGES
jgi:hypothetical protein